MASSANVDEKCEQNDKILNHILKQPFAELFSNLQYALKSYHLEVVPPSSVEYSLIQMFFLSTSGNKMFIRQIQRIENPFLIGQYHLKKEMMVQEGQILNEERLFHGTRHIHEICSDNFNWRLRGTSRGYKFGQGVSFSPHSSYASHYTQGSNTIIIAKVLVGRSTFGNSETKIPPLSYNSTQNIPGSVIVKYEDSEFYPEYIVYYHR